MSEKEKNRIAEKMSEFILLMGYNADFQVVIAKELNRQIWLSSENLCRKQCRELLYLLYMSDSATLLSYTVSLGRLVWRIYLRAKRRILKRKLSEKIREREREREKRKKKSILVAVLARGQKVGAVYSKKANMKSARYTIGFLMRLRLVYKVVRRVKSKQNVKVGSRVYRLGLAMGFLSFRNVCVTSEWEFLAVCLVQQVFGFWRSISIGGELDGSFVGIAQKFGLDVVSDRYSVTSQHINILQQVLEDRSAEETIIRSYKRSFSGFAARLTEKEYDNLKGKKEVVSVFPSRTLQLQTTRSWDFLGFPEPTRKQFDTQSDIIIGVLDTGIWPESPSFNDDGLGPVPMKWKGGCHGGQNFTCNKKIIGARGYLGTARDDDGHGTHTASTVAGRKVDGINFFGTAKGSARGGVPSARIAVYKVCDPDACKEADMLAAFDDAIADGVDLITISIGGQATGLDTDAVAIGAFHAMARGILTVQAAGNEGDDPGSTGSVAPWVFSVAASTIDRQYIDRVVLGNGKTIIGSSVNTFALKGSQFPLVYGKAVSSQCDESFAKSCDEACLDQRRVKGKIIVCDDIDPFKATLKAGALGVLAPSRFDNQSVVLPLPGVSLNEPEFTELKSYLSSTKAPKAYILKSETITDPTAPVVAPFSSRGPNKIASDILKPDISAPGVNILAAFSPIGAISDYTEDKRSVKYNVLSGTSMACPHVAGAAAYVKSVHPQWSPAAIKSALMTTADPIGNSKNPDAEFAYGSGHLNPTKAINPGLVYNSFQKHYITFLCKSGYDKVKIGKITGISGVTCPNKHHHTPIDVNYPSMSALITAYQAFTVKFKRSVTNVGVARSTYTAKVTNGSGMKVTVNPSVLSFKSLKEIKVFYVIVQGEGLSSQSLDSASIVWTDGIHTVRSPIVLYTN